MVQKNLTGETPEVFIDVHEVDRKSESSITLFRDKLRENDVFYQVKKLEVGDLILVGDYDIERKTVPDFCHSLFGSRQGNPRLMHQMRSLIETYDNPILLLEGGNTVKKNPMESSIYYLKHQKPHSHSDYLYWSLEREINMHPNQFQGALNKIQEMGVTIIQTFDEKDGAEQLWELFSEADKETQENKQKPPTIRQKPKLKTLLDKQIFLLSGFPQISTIRAKKLLNKFQNPYSVIKNVEKWDQVKGIGEKTVAKVKKILFLEEEN